MLRSLVIATDTPERASPYRGLEPFGEEDAAFFFGREREARLIVASMFAAPLTLLYGASGVGKSSVLRAGVLPRLREREDILPVVFPTLVREPTNTGSTVVARGWQNDALQGIKEAIAFELVELAGADSRQRRKIGNLVRAHNGDSLREFLVMCQKASQRRLMIILDQFEEYALYHPEDDDFAEQFPPAIVPAEISVRFVVSLREDALAKLDRFKGRIRTLWDSYRRVDHLDRVAAEDAIRLPLREYNRQRSSNAPISIEDALVEAVLTQVQAESVQFETTGSGTLPSEATPGAAQRIETPYLQLVMTRLWEREQTQGSSTLRSKTLQSEGGAASIVRTHLDRVMQQFAPDEQDIAARIFSRLVTPSGAKIAFSANDLASYEGVPADKLALVLRRLEEGDRRILRRVAARNQRSDEPRYEIFHDQLGKAVLDWRAKRLSEQERERGQHEEAVQKRVAEETRARYREEIERCMQQLGEDGQAIWARALVYMVTPSGAKLAQTAHSLSEFSGQPASELIRVLDQLVGLGLLRASSAGEDFKYELTLDAYADVLREWLAQYVDTRTAEKFARSVAPSEQSGDAREANFPYETAYSLLLEGRLVPFIGSGVSLSARSREFVWSPDQPFLPSAREFKSFLASMCQFPPSELAVSNVAEVASYFAQRLGRVFLDEVVHSALGRQGLVLSETHRFLAEVCRRTPLVILTTNYDGQMEKALDEIGQPYDTLTFLIATSTGRRVAYLPYGEHEPKFVRNPFEFEPGGQNPLVCRLSGPALVDGEPVGGYVVTEEDELDWLLEAFVRENIPPFMHKLFLNPLLSLGQSASDLVQRAVLRTIASTRLPYGSRRRSWAVALDPSPLSVLTWQRYDVEVFNIELNQWTSKMRAAADAGQPGRTQLSR